jgi:hypothetical protein
MKPMIVIKNSRRLFWEGLVRLVVASTFLAAMATAKGTDNLTHQRAMTHTAMVSDKVRK